MENNTSKVAAADSAGQTAVSFTVTPVPAKDANGQASFMITVAPNTAPVVKTIDDTSSHPPSAVPVRSARMD